ncbi:MAG: T9SS type A sorting domain-containing protein [Bacteroidetes bacterium]|nr:T9SS type A sorting domain-containing protein [Bacteroidota bacterium]
MRQDVLFLRLLLGIIMMLALPAISQPPILILNLDGNNNSAPVIGATLDSLDADYEILTTFPADLSVYEGVFVCLGIFSSNYILTNNDGQLLADYLNNGGSIYMEGGDTWYYDPPTIVHPMFNINATADGTNDLGTILGQAGTFTEDMSFSYTGENSWIDHLEPIAPAFKILENQAPLYGTGIAYDAGTYKTIGVSHEFGGLSDGASPSTKVELMTEYLEFLDISLSPEASFYSSDTLICENDIVYFYDASSGNIITWNWIFEGAIPGTSSNQNPVVAYPGQGSWDVYLEVSDGIETSQLYLNEYITVGTVPPAAPTPSGISLLCANWGNTSYNTIGLSGITEYDWIIDPPEAGTISGAGTNVTVVWEEDFMGEADLMVAGINYCGIGAYSEPYTITRYLPDVSVMLPAFVALSTPPFALTGGLPVGGEYTGPGVTNNIFDPASAGLGMHTITYTYTDINLCTNSAIDSIGVTQYTGIKHQDDQSTINIYPNPTNGSFKVQFNTEEADVVTIKIFNSLNEMVWEMNNVSIHNKFTQLILLKNHQPGIYYMQISGKKVHSSHKIIFRE